MAGPACYATLMSSGFLTKPSVSHTEIWMMLLLSAVHQACLHFTAAWGVCVCVCVCVCAHCVYVMLFVIQARHKEILLVRAGMCCLRVHIRQ